MFIGACYSAKPKLHALARLNLACAWSWTINISLLTERTNVATESLFFPQRYLNRIAQVVALDCYDFVVVTLRFDLELQTTHMNRQQHNNPIIIRRAPAFAKE